MKRHNYISWDEFFMGVAELAAQRSKDPSTRHGCCIVNPVNNNILSVGYNGLPKGLDDDGCYGYSAVVHDDGEWTPKRENYWDKPIKYEFVVHAEENAFFNAQSVLTGASLYLYSDKNYLPCSRCARGIIQNGIKEVVVRGLIEKNTDVYDWGPTKHMFEQAKIKIRKI